MIHTVVDMDGNVFVAGLGLMPGTRIEMFRTCTGTLMIVPDTTPVIIEPKKVEAINAPTSARARGRSFAHTERRGALGTSSTQPA